MQPDKPKPPASQDSPDYELIKEFIAVRNKELDVRKSRIEERVNFQDNMKEVALASIEAQRKDRQESRDASKSESTKNKTFVVVLVLILGVFSGFLVWQGYTSLAEKIITYLLAVLLGAFGGYGYAIKVTGSMQGPTE